MLNVEVNALAPIGTASFWLVFKRGKRYSGKREIASKIESLLSLYFFVNNFV